MSTSSKHLIEQNQIIPAWLELFLHRTFFGACSEHEIQKNELNTYCITCDMAACRYCLTTGIHDDHNLLKIYRHVYQDVVLLKEIEDHIDCSNIQPYKCNRKWIVALNPLPHCGSGAQIDEDLSCLVCKRKLMDPGQYRYCCISCKVEALRGKRKEERRKRRRKGDPTRAPLS